MAVTSYSYTKEVNVDKLKLEIIASAIVHALENIVLNGTDLIITFKDAISVGDKTLLDGLITAHVNTPLGKIEQTFDADGAAMSRKKITDKGDHYQSRFFIFETSTKDSISCKGYDGVDTGEATIKFFDKNDTDITDQTQETLNAECVRTEVDLKPPFDFKVMKGQITLDHETSDKAAFLFCRLAPLLGSTYGEKDMIHGLPLRSLKAGEWKLFDGEAPKPIVQALFQGTPNFRKRVWHSPGSQITVIAEFILFKK